MKMNSRSTAISQSDAETRQRREARERKPVREWTAEERREAFLELRIARRHKAEAGVLDEWELCEECHENRRERGTRWCQPCIEQVRQYAD
jgi:hypothetical protein